MKNIAHRCGIGAGAFDRAAPCQILNNPDPFQIVTPCRKPPIGSQSVRAGLNANPPPATLETKTLIAFTLRVNACKIHDRAHGPFLYAPGRLYPTFNCGL